MTGYKVRYEECGDQVGCDACGYEAPVADFPVHRTIGLSDEERKGTKILCEICACTVSGNAVEYPEQYPDRDVIYMIAWIGNHVIEKIREAEDDEGY